MLSRVRWLLQTIDGKSEPKSVAFVVEFGSNFIALYSIGVLFLSKQIVERRLANQILLKEVFHITL